MKKITFILFIFIFLFSCGGIKNLNYGEPFTAEEKKTFSDIFTEYKANDYNGQLQISSLVGDNLITVEGHYPPPNQTSTYEYNFTKENGKFICRAYSDGSIEARYENSNFETLLRQVLRL